MSASTPLTEDPIGPDGLTEAQRRSRRSRSIALGIAVGLLVILMLALTLAKGPSIIQGRPL